MKSARGRLAIVDSMNPQSHLLSFLGRHRTGMVGYGPGWVAAPSSIAGA
ncbi:MAG: hypothetical protein ACXWUC_11525 [Methylosarcina sp.]